MKSASPALIAYLNTVRAQSDSTLLMADCFTFTLLNGTVLTYTNFDISITWNGFVFLADSILVDGLHYKCSVGLDVDQQKITIAGRPTDTVEGVPFLQALANGVFDGAEIQRERVFCTPGPPWPPAPIGSVILFKGRVGTIDTIGRTSAQLTVNSDLVLLDIKMPRNLYAPSCQHVLYDAGCGLNRANFAFYGEVGAGSSNSVVVVATGGLSDALAQGRLIWTGGANAAKSVTVKSATAPYISLAYPLQNVPQPGDTFTAYFGCDHTMAACQSKFNNLPNFRGFPFVPPPVFAA
ncbi:DUF2163 domain-containing protein [Methylovirgula sp. HY1]|uniref:DUF2163 domain-containing protein n=1 Tax=Methylovirgula sp. HY1 TaxID=2822761 RepID=UPI001C5BA4A7|nr:DUF2163 domain-containing protein [Methylovirgula sp. HY1]QXX74232.1 hypothetical protein MHY1_01042 [Methylovirgula sp. HY1]